MDHLNLPPRSQAFFKHWLTRLIIFLLLLGGVGKLAGGAQFLYHESALLGHSKAAPWLIPILAFWVIISPWYVVYVLRKDARVATISPASAYLGHAKELLPVAERSRYQMTSGTWEMMFDGEYGVSHRFTMVIVAVERSLFVIRQHRMSASSPALDLSMLEFKARWMEGGGAVCTLPALDHPTRREFLVFFDPPLEPGSAPRELEITSKWPAAAKKLQKVNEWDENGWTVPGQVVGVVGQIKLKFNFERKLGGRFALRLRCAHEAEARPDDIVNAGETWEKEVADVPVGTLVGVSVRRIE